MRIRLALLLLIAVCLTPLAAQAAPDMSIAEPKKILEQSVLEGETVSWDFVVENKGDEELVIESVTPG